MKQQYTWPICTFCWLLLSIVIGKGTLAADSSESDADGTVEGDDGGFLRLDSQRSEFTDLFEELAQASFREKVAIIDELAATEDTRMARLFEVMSVGNLYYEASSQRMFRIRGDGEKALGLDVMTGELVDGLEEDGLEKIRINNPLRGHLNRQIARINLVNGDRSMREEAARSLLDAIDADVAGILREALSAEDDAAVRELIRTGIAMHELNSSSDQAVRLDAIEHLSGRLESPVRNLLRSYAPDGFMEEPDEEVAEAAGAALSRVEGKISFYRVVEQFIFGLSLGSVLLLAAIGLAVTFGVMGVINMAHGEMLMLGAYTTYVMQQLMPGHLTASIVFSIPAAFVVAGLVGMLIQRFVIRYLEGRPLETLLATFGISLILQQSVRTIFSPLNRMVSSPEWLSGSLQINPVLSVTYNRLYILVFALLVFAVLQLILKKTSLGLNVRAVSQNRSMARAMGVRAEWVDAMTFGLGTGIAGIAGVALSQLTNVGPSLGQSYIIDSFMVVVFGGVGNLLGALVGAFSIGVASNFLEPLTGSVLAKILILVFIILFIQKRPKGLFPQKGRAAE